jgi:hypothetical protein
MVFFSPQTCLSSLHSFPLNTKNILQVELRPPINRWSESFIRLTFLLAPPEEREKVLLSGRPSVGPRPHPRIISFDKPSSENTRVRSLTPPPSGRASARTYLGRRANRRRRRRPTTAAAERQKQRLERARPAKQKQPAAVGKSEIGKLQFITESDIWERRVGRRRLRPWCKSDGAYFLSRLPFFWRSRLTGLEKLGIRTHIRERRSRGERR